MFEKLLSNLPYNPSLVHQLGFYAKRMRREEGVRRTGLVFLVLAFFIQFFAVVAPPVATVAYSTNDMINGGFTSKSEAVSACRNNTKNYGDVLADFGISCSAVSNATTVTISSTDHNKQLYSMGWLSYGTKNPTSGKTTGEVPLNLDNVSETLYARYLWSFDTGDHSDYKALKVTASTGKTYYILYTCGNLVAIGVPVPLPTQPKDVCPNKTGVQTSQSDCDVCSNLPGVQTSTSQCDVCSNIPGTQTSASQCDVCSNVTGVQTSNTQCDVCPNLAGVQTKSSQCDVCSNVTGVQTSLDQCDVCSNISGVQTSATDCNPPTTSTCPYDSSLPLNSPDCKACDQGSQLLLDCLQISKTAENQTQNMANADGTTAQAGDVIKYTLHATNTAKITVKQFSMEESLSDVLDYATVKDLDGGTLDDATKLVTWPAQDIAAGATETHTITVVVGIPDANGQRQIPNTPPDPGDPGHFDHVMTNVYGNAININLPGSVVTTVITTSDKLVNTGPGTSLAIAGAIVIVAGYFFARARLLVDETVIAVHQTANHGGM